MYQLLQLSFRHDQRIRGISESLSRSWIRTKLSFSLLKTANLCIRGTRSKAPPIEVSKLADTNISMAVIDAKDDTTLDNFSKILCKFGYFDSRI